MGAIVYLLSGIIFSVGLGLAGMLQPSKVVGFLNPLDENGWDPSLAFVMVGAIGVHLVLYKLTIKREKPVCAEKFSIPTRGDINKRLIVGSALFGAGWGVAGYCPGPGLASLATGADGVFAFVGAMFLGMVAFELALNAWNKSKG